MVEFFKSLWANMFSKETPTNADVERIAALQRVASERRAEYAQAKEQAEANGDTGETAQLLAIRKRVNAAETAHNTALQMWTNKHTRQKSH